MTLITICWHNIVASIRGQMQYRASFILELLFGLLFQSVGFIFVALVLTRFDAVAGWSLWEVGLLYSIRLVAHGLWTISVNQLFRFDRIVQDGEWDRYLIRPMPLWAQLMFTQMRIPVLGDLLSGLVVLGLVLPRVEVDWTPVLALYLVLAILGGALIDGAFQLGAAAFTFRYLETLPLRILFDQVQDRFASFPANIYERPLRMLMTWFIPMAFMAWVPATVLLDRTEELPFPAWVGWASPLIGFVLMAGAVWLFARQSRHYQSAGH